MAERQAVRRRRPGANEVPAFFLYGEPLKTPDEHTLHVETIAARSRLHEWTIRAHRHRDLLQVLLLQRGRVEAAIDREHVTLRAPAIVIVPAGSVHSFRFQPQTVGIVLSLGSGIARDVASTTRGLIEFLDRPRAHALDPASMRATDVAPLAQMLLREFERSAPGRDVALKGLAGALLANLLRLADTQATRRAPRTTPDRELVARFRRLVEQRYRDRCSIAGCARDLGTSETRLRRACLAVAGQSPVELLHQRLVIEAERQLRYTSMPVTQVAYFLGFEDPAYFSRFFTRRLGLSPRTFRQRAGGL
jgi:AraC family transcriptional regulator, transcriptional activator of pobA